MCTKDKSQKRGPLLQSTEKIDLGRLKSATHNDNDDDGASAVVVLAMVRNPLIHFLYFHV